MSKRFNISLGLEESNLEVDKAVKETIEEKTKPESKKVLDDAVANAEDQKKEEDKPADTNEAPVDNNTPSDKTTEEMPEIPEAEFTGDAEQAPSLSDIADDVKENEDNNEEVKVASEAIVTLESIIEELENSLDTGGISPVAAQVTGIVVQDVCDRVGLQNEEEIAQESFKTPSSRIRNTKIAIESIFDKIKSIIQAIIASVSRGIQWIKNFIKSINDKYAQFKKQIEQLKSTLALVKVDKISDANAKFTKQGVINNLKARNGINVQANMDTLTKFVIYFEKLEDKERVSSLNVIQNVIKGISEETSRAPEIIKLDGIKQGNVVSGYPIPGVTVPNEQLELLAYKDVFPGEKIFVAVFPKENIEKVQDFNTALKEAYFDFHVNQHGNKEITELDIADKAEITKIVDSLNNLLNTITTASKSLEKFVNTKEEIQKALKVLESSQKDLNANNEKQAKKDGKEFTPIDNFKAINARLMFIDRTYVVANGKLSTVVCSALDAGIHYSAFCVNKLIEENQKKKYSNSLIFRAQAIDNTSDDPLMIDGKMIMDQSGSETRQEAMSTISQVSIKGKLVFDKDHVMLYQLKSNFLLEVISSERDVIGRIAPVLCYGNHSHLNQVIEGLRNFGQETEHPIPQEQLDIAKEALKLVKS